MADFTLRTTNENDLDKLLKLWHQSFGDSKDFARAMLLDCSLLSTAVCAELDGEVRSAMFAFDGIEIYGIKASYIYALCTEQEYRSRGLGRAVCAYAAEKARERGAGLVFLRPANRELEKWYTSALGALPFGGSSVEKLSPLFPAPVKAVEIGVEEYRRRRGKQPWFLPDNLLRAQETVHRHYGGAFLSCGETLLCAEKSCSSVLIREIIGPEHDSAIAAAAEYFGMKSAEILRKNENGLPLMCLPPFPETKFELIPPLSFTID